MFVFNLNRFFKTSRKSILLPVLACVFLSFGCGGGGGEGEPGTPADPVISAWSRLVGAAGKATNALAVAVDGEGYSYITGFTTGIIDPDRTGSVSRDAFIARYDRDGERLWIKQLGYETKFTVGQGIAVDKSGNSYVVGWTNGNLEAGSGSATGDTDFFVAKYDKDGALKWVKQLGDNNFNVGYAVAVDDSGNTYITGYTDGDLDGAGPGTLTGIQDIFVAKYNTLGVQQWVKQLGAQYYNSQGKGIAVDQDGNSYATGYTEGDLGSGKTGPNDVFIVKYDTLGNKKWVIQKGVSGKDTWGFGIAVDASGNCHVTGYTKGDLGGPGTLVGDKDVFVMKYDTAGQFKWLKQTSESGKDAVGYGIALDSAGNCYATGITNADLDGAGPNVFKGDNELFVIAYDTNGASLWIRQMASSVTSNDLKALGIAATRNGTCIVAGYVTENFDEQSLTGSSDAFITTKLNK